MARSRKRSSLAGSWYPADPGELRALVEKLIGEDRGAEPDACAFIVPHAGYRYSGETAGAAYARIPRGRWRRALVLAPSHYAAFTGAAIFPGEAFETPLGAVSVEQTAVKRLVAQPLFEELAEPYEREHSLEIQLPFLQVVDREMTIVPILIGVAEDADALDVVAEGLRAVIDDETLVLVSSDFTHYGAHFDYLPFPAAGAVEVASELRRLDFGAIHPICDGDAEGFARYVRSTGITICGRGPISAFLRLERGELEGEVAKYATSLDVTGDYEHSVSYAAIAFQPSETAAA